MPRGIHRLGVILVLLLVLPFMNTPSIAQQAQQLCSDYTSISLNYTLAVVLLGFTEQEAAETEAVLGPWSSLLRVQDCMYNITFTPIIVDGSGWLEDRVRRYLDAAYEDLGTPGWVMEYMNSTGRSVTVKWVKLKDFYMHLYTSTRQYLEALGVEARDTVVVLGDIDGYSRQYYDATGYPYTINKTLRLEGVRGWSGPLPLTFYDLSVIPRPRPEPTMPYYGQGIPVDYERDPPIWDLRARGEVADYIAGLVVGHARYHIIGFPLYGPTPLVVTYNLTIIDFGNQTVMREVLNQVDEGEIIRLTHTMIPWAGVKVHVRVINSTMIPGLHEYVSSLEPGSDGFITLDYARVSNILSKIVEGQDTYFPEFKYTFIILATDKPSRFQYKTLKFTGFSAGEWGATSWPGHGYRIYQTGLPRVVAHELGHSIGEQHPFEYFEPGAGYGMRWLMDWEATVMSYENAAIAGFIEAGWAYIPNYYNVFRQSLSYIAYITQLLYNNSIISLEEAKTLLDESTRDPTATLTKILALYIENAGQQITVTRERTMTVTIPVTVTTTTTIQYTTTHTSTATYTLIKTTTTPITITTTTRLTMTMPTTITEYYTEIETMIKTITSTIAETKTQTQTITIQKEHTTTQTIETGASTIQALATLLAGILLGALATIIYRRR